MANSDKNIIITPNIGSAVADPKIVFSGADGTNGAQNITLQVYPTNSGTLSFEGSAGQLFSITNSLSGTIYSVNDVSGIPSIEVLDTGLIKLAQYSGNVVLGSGTDTGLAKLQVTGSLSVTGSFIGPGTGLTGTAASLSIGGNAATATSASSIDGIAFNNSNSTTPVSAPDTLDSNGIGYVTNVSLLGQTDGALYSQAWGSTYQHQIFGDYRTGQMAIRGKNNNVWQAWRTVLDSTNWSSFVTSYVTGVTGTAPIVSSGGTAPAISISAATTLAAGSMSAADKTKLDGIASGATANTGTVTSVGLSAPALFTVSGSPVTTSGTLALSYSGTALPVANGGTGGTTIADARTNLGATTLGANLFTITNPTAITFPRFNADNTVSSLDAATFRTAIGAGTSSTTGTVTSVGGTGTVSGLTLTGTVTSTGNLTLGGTLAVTASNFASQTANTFLSAPNGTAGVPTFRAIVAADIPTLNQNTTGTSANVTGTVAIANGGTAATTATAALTNLGGATRATFGTNPESSLKSVDIRSITNPTTGIGYVGGGRFRFAHLDDITAPYADVIDLSTYTDASGGGFNSLYFSKSSQTIQHKYAAAAGTSWISKTLSYTDSNITGTAANVTGTVAIANGGTAATTAASARTNLGATTVGSNLFTLTNPTAITFPRFNADNTVSTLDAATFRTAIGAGTSSTTGTVTSVSVTTNNGISGTVATSGTTPAISLSIGALTGATSITMNGATSGTVQLLPTAIAGTGTVLTLPATTGTLALTSQLTSGTVTSISTSGTVSGLTLTGGTITTTGTITLGGTLAVTASNFASQTANTFLSAPNGTAGVPTFRAIVAADVPTLNQNTTGTAANVTGTVAVANGGTGAATLTLNNVLLGNGTSALQAVAPGVTGNVLTSNGTTWISSTPTGGGGGITYTRYTTNVTAVDKQGIIADTTGGQFTVTLPATPATGAQVVVVDGGSWGTTNLIVARNGSTIENLAEDMFLDITGAAVTFIYDSTTWEVYSQVGAAGGTAVTLTGTETLTNKTLTNPIFTGYTETVNATYTTALNPANGTIQRFALTGNTTFTDSLASGQSITLMIDDGTAFTITWPTTIWVGGTAPTLATTGYTVIEIWKVSTTLYGALVGTVA